jgi:Ca2+/Na+ antiporter
MLTTGKALKAGVIVFLVCLLPSLIFLFHLAPAKETESTSSFFTLDTCSSHYMSHANFPFMVIVFCILWLFFPVFSRFSEIKSLVYRTVFAGSIEKPPLKIS